MKNDALEIIKKCKPCQQFGIVRKGFHPLSPISAELPGDHWAIDLVGPFTTSTKGNHYLLVCIDIFSRFCLLRAIPDKRAITVALILIQIFSDFGFPRIIQSDNGTEFVNSLIKIIV